MWVGPEGLEPPVRDAADLQSAPMPSPVTDPKVEIYRISTYLLNVFILRNSLDSTKSLLQNSKNPIYKGDGNIPNRF